MTDLSIPETRTAGVIIRPPLLYLGALAAGFTLDHLLPIPVVIPREGELLHRLVPASLALLGLTLAFVGIRNFTRAGTPVPTTQPTRSLVTTGIHGWTRNPIYVGMTILYLAIGIAVRSPWIISLIIPILLIIRYGVIAREERYLSEQFGDSYSDYVSKVRRWI
jgi:protein-S-isoprenylcysteine O-methyltransferase Ste14